MRTLFCCLSLFTLLSLSFHSMSQPWKEKGKLQVSENGHYLEHENGEGFFWLGCTAWMLSRLAPDDIDRYLDDRIQKGFNVIQFTSTNMGRENFEDEQPFSGEEGRPWKAMKPNEKYWKHVDYIIEKAREKGLYVAIFVWWGTGAGDPKWKEGEGTRMYFRNPDRDNYLFGQFLGERYNKHPHIIWVGAGEYHKPVSVMFPKNQRPLTDQHKSRLTAVIEGIKSKDNPGEHLYTIHPISFVSSSEEFHDAEWLDFNMIQTHAVAEFIVPLTQSDWNREPVKPTFNSEGWYENEHHLYAYWTGMDKKEEYEIDADWKQRYQAWWSVFSGGFGFTYGHKNLWRMESLEGKPGVLQDEVLNAPGASSFIHLKTLMTSKKIQERVPDPQLISAATIGRDAGLSPDLRIGTKSIDGHWAFIYSTMGSLIRVNMQRLATGNVSAYWYNPRNGLWRVGDVESAEKTSFEKSIPSGEKSQMKYFDPPGNSQEGNDWVLVLELE